MLLAGLLLKMGSYGLVRICLGFFPYFFIDYGPQIMALGAFNIVWAAMACLIQKDMKRIIALSSVSHMGFVLLGVASFGRSAQRSHLPDGFPWCHFSPVVLPGGRRL